MAKKPDTPCAGGCGKLLWSGRGALPAGERKCRECRNWTGKKETRAIPCGHCGQEFTTTRPAATYCSVSCGTQARLADRTQFVPRPCVHCGTPVSAPGRAVVCAPCRPARRLVIRRQKDSRRRALLYSAPSEAYTTEEIAERDGYRCGLCRSQVDMTKVVPDLGAPTIDHLVPLSRGGDDSRANVQLAHFGCNVAKGPRGGGEQLALL